MRLTAALCCLALIAVMLVLTAPAPPAQAYVGGPPLSLGIMCSWSTHAAIVRIEKLDREKHVIIFRKVQDLKGKWPAEIVRHNFTGLGPAERDYALQWAEVGKTVVFFALESYKWGHFYIDGLWYAANTGDWQNWTVTHPEPLMLRMYCGKTDRLVSAITAMYAGKEVVVPGMVDGNVEDLKQRRAKVQRLRASLKLSDYNPKRDFVSMGGDDFVSISSSMPGFSQYAPLPRAGADAQVISSVDIDGDGKPDLCLAGPNKVVLLLNGGDYFTEVPLPGFTGGCRAAVWADYNGDGKPDLLLATATGPKLFTNLGGGNFRDDTARLPVEPAYNLTAAAWIDYDGDGHPDILLGNGFHGLRLYRNKGLAEPKPQPALPAAPPLKPGQTPPPQPPWFEDVSTLAGLGPDGIGSNLKGDTLTVCDVNGDGRPDFLYGAGSGILALGSGKGFVEAKDSGIEYRPGKVGPVFGDFDNDGLPDLFVPQPDGCKLFRNDGKGHFTDVTEKAGLDKFSGQATCAAWGDVDNDGRLDLVVGCLHGPNRFFRNKSDGSFEDASEKWGLQRRTFNSQAVCLVDLNNDGVLDMVFNNEGQESCALLGNPAVMAKRAAVTLQVAGPDGVIGSQVRLLDPEGRLRGFCHISGGDGRGGQAAPLARFAVQPGQYRVEVRYSSGVRRGREITVAGASVRGLIGEQTPRIE
jgi:hypothetical protein